MNAIRRASFPPRLEALDAVFAFMAAACADCGIAGDARRDVDFVVEELFTNMAKYGACRGPVEIAVASDGTDVQVTLIEHAAEPYDPRLAPAVDIDRPAEQRRPGGLGLHLVRELTGSLEYHYAPETREATTRFRPRRRAAPEEGE